MEVWGAALFGEPCRECGFDWTLSSGEALQWMARASDHFTTATCGATGTERAEGWSVAEYVSHVGDNLRQWVERVQAARLAGVTHVSGYNPDELASARNYASIPLPVALWSLRFSAQVWCTVLRDAVGESVVLEHATRGAQTATDIVRNNTHDARHHLWDISRILRR